MESKIIKISYKYFKEVKSKEEFFTSWDNNVDNLTEALKTTIYNKYVVKCRVFQRDNFECQNELCQTPERDLTLHHVRWQKNGGKDAERNCLTLCHTCHQGFHKGKRDIKVKDRCELPAHIKGHTFVFEKEYEINWKQIKAEMKGLRKNVRQYHGIRLTSEQLRILMTFLYSPYEDLE